jgi:integrase
VRIQAGAAGRDEEARCGGGDAQRTMALACRNTCQDLPNLESATTWLSRRDHALLLLACQTGLRVSELTSLTRSDVHLSAGAHVHCHGKAFRSERFSWVGWMPVVRQVKVSSSRQAHRTTRRTPSTGSRLKDLHPQVLTIARQRPGPSSALVSSTSVHHSQTTPTTT